jgi:ABC-type Fe3+/spermidine/putrescine transport system ATPase subunit
VFVTHDQEEALVMSDRIAVMQAGRISQLDTPENIYRTPANQFVAGFIGESNLYRARVTGPGTAQLESGLQVHLPPVAASASAQEVGLMIRPERIRQLGPGSTADVALEGSIEEVVYLGETIKCRIRTKTPGPSVLARWPLSASGPVPGVGDRVQVGWQRTDVHCFAWT